MSDVLMHMWFLAGGVGWFGADGVAGGVVRAEAGLHSSKLGNVSTKTITRGVFSVSYILISHNPLHSTPTHHHHLVCVFLFLLSSHFCLFVSLAAHPHQGYIPHTITFKPPPYCFVFGMPWFRWWWGWLRLVVVVVVVVQWRRVLAGLSTMILM